jgi:hypothetical protein
MFSNIVSIRMKYHAFVSQNKWSIRVFISEFSYSN